MAQDIDLTSQKWLALVFENKNKEYGAYVMRNDSSNRHLKALIIVAVACMASIILPKIIKAIVPQHQDLSRDDVVVMADIDLNQKVPEENIIKAIDVPPPPELKSTIKFNALKVVEDEKVTDENMALSQQDLFDSQADISIKTIEGSDTGIDIALLQDGIIAVKEEEPEIFNHVEKMPAFPGGEAELMKWLQKNIDYPEIAKEQNIQGTVNLRFVVKPDGSIDDVQIIKSLDKSCDQEAVRAMKKMPRWIPGEQNGKAVNVYYNLPVRFKLQTS
jgi:protein TonB